MELREPLREFIAEELLSGELPVGDDDNLLADGMVDSLGVVRLVGFIEQQFGYKTPPGDVTIDHFRTVNQLAEYLESRIRETA